MSNIFKIRTEGRRYNVAEDTVNVTNIIIGFTFYRYSPQIIDVDIESHIRLPGGTSGVFSSDTLINSPTFYAGNSYRITSTGIDTCTVSNIYYNAPASAASLEYTINNNDRDDDFSALNIPWDITFLGRTYKGNEVFISTNTYLTFGTNAGSSTIGVTATTPPFPKLSIGNADNRMTLIKSSYYYNDYVTAVAPVLGDFDMAKTWGDSSFTITQPSSNNNSGGFTYTITSGSDVISISGTTITILRAGSATVQATQSAVSGSYLEATKSATITINRAAASLTASNSMFIQKFVPGGSVNFGVISSNAGIVVRTYESNDLSVITIPTSSSPFAALIGPGKTTIKVTQPETTNYTQVVNNSLITIIIVGQNRTYTSEDMTSIDFSSTNLSGTIFSICNLTGANLFGATVSTSTDLTTSTLTSLMSGKIIGTTSLLPVGYKMI